MFLIKHTLQLKSTVIIIIILSIIEVIIFIFLGVKLYFNNKRIVIGIALIVLSLVIVSSYILVEKYLIIYKSINKLQTKYYH